jgi:hypothetical protein
LKQAEGRFGLHKNQATVREGKIGIHSSPRTSSKEHSEDPSPLTFTPNASHPPFKKHGINETRLTSTVGRNFLFTTVLTRITRDADYLVSRQFSIPQDIHNLIFIFI